MTRPARPAAAACIEVWDHDAEQWTLIEQHDEPADAIRQAEHHLDTVTQSAVLLGLTPGAVRVLACDGGPVLWELR